MGQLPHITEPDEPGLPYGGLFHTDKRPARGTSRARTGAGRRDTVTEENAAHETDQTADQAVEQPEQDYKALYEQVKAESRKWESRSKANAKELGHNARSRICSRIMGDPCSPKSCLTSMVPRLD